MADYDPELGKKVNALFKDKGIESPFVDDGKMLPSTKVRAIQEDFTNILATLGMNLDDDSIADTPKRVAKMFVYETFYGLDYTQFPKCTTTSNGMIYDEMVLSRNCIIRSTCEHHFQPIYGKAHIAYIPSTRVLGLSKLNRVADFFARRPQVQERLTVQIFQALSYILETNDVAVVIEADHFCVKMRGIMDACSDTVTSKMGGRFLDVPALREELMSLIRRPSCA